MTGQELFEDFHALIPEEQQHLLRMLALHLDLDLPDSTHVLLPREEFEGLVAIMKRAETL